MLMRGLHIYFLASLSRVWADVMREIGLLSPY